MNEVFEVLREQADCSEIIVSAFDEKFKSLTTDEKRQVCDGIALMQEMRNFGEKAAKELVVSVSILLHDKTDVVDGRLVMKGKQK